MTDSYYIDIPLSKVRVSSLHGIMYLCIYVPPSLCDICIVQCSQQVLLLYERKEVTSRKKKRKESSGLSYLTITSIYFVYTYVVSPDDNNSFQSFFPPCNHIKALNNESNWLRRNPPLVKKLTLTFKIEHISLLTLATLLVYLFHAQNAYEALQGQQDFSSFITPPAFFSPPLPHPFFFILLIYIIV